MFEKKLPLSAEARRIGLSGVVVHVNEAVGPHKLVFGFDQSAPKNHVGADWSSTSVVRGQILLHKNGDVGRVSGETRGATITGIGESAARPVLAEILRTAIKTGKLSAVFLRHADNLEKS